MRKIVPQAIFRFASDHSGQHHYWQGRNDTVSPPSQTAFRC
jgi:hypothetical protein